jgi:hypothetical protein
MLLLLPTLLGLGIGFGGVGTSGTAEAHNFNNGYSYVHLNGNAAEFELLLPYPILTQYDTNQDGRVDQGELDRQRTEIDAYMQDHLQLFNNLLQMEFRLLDLKPVVQQDTEDPMVQFDMRFTSEAEIDKLDIAYNVILNDIDPTHQNYIQVYNGESLVAQRVVEKGDSRVEYVTGGDERFPVRLLGIFAVLGIGHILRSPAFWLFALTMALPLAQPFAQLLARPMPESLVQSLAQPIIQPKTKSLERMRLLLEMATFFAGANLVGCVASFRFGYTLPIVWVSGLAGTLVFAAAAANVWNGRRGQAWRKAAHGDQRLEPSESWLARYGWRKAAAAVFGFAHGLATFTYIIKLGAPGEYKFIFMGMYDFGVYAAFAALMCGIGGLAIWLARLLPRTRWVLWGSAATAAANLFVLVTK